jgi:hypothetical protein
MFRYPNPTHYLNSLATRARRGGPKPKQAPRKKRQGQGQGKGKAKPKPRRRRGTAAEAEPEYMVGPDGRLYIASDAGYGAARPQLLQAPAMHQPRQQQQLQAPAGRRPRQQQQVEGLAGGLQQYVRTHDGQLLWIGKRRGIKTAKLVKSGKEREGPFKHNYQGEVIGPDNQVWIVQGDHIRHANQHEIDKVKKYKEKANKAHVQGNAPRKPKKLPADPHGAAQAIRKHMKLFASWCKTDPAPDFAVVKTGEEHQKVVEVMSTVRKLAEDIMTGSGYFEGKRPSYKGGMALQYLYYDKMLDELIRVDNVPHDKVPKYLKDFDHAWHGTSESMTNHEKFCALRAFFGHLMTNVRHAIIFQHSYTVGKKKRDEIANRVAEKTGVSNTGTVRGNLEEAARKLFANQTLPPIKAGKTKELIFRQLCVMVAQNSGKHSLTYEELIAYCGHENKPELVRYIQRNKNTFQREVGHVHRIMKKIQKNRERPRHSHPASEERAPEEEAQATVQPTAAPRVALNLVSMRN